MYQRAPSVIGFLAELSLVHIVDLPTTSQMRRRNWSTSFVAVRPSMGYAKTKKGILTVVEEIVASKG